MSKERAVRRAAREAEREQRAVQRQRLEAAEVQRRERRARWRRRLAWLPGVGTRWSRSTGPLAVKRRRVWGLVALAFLVVQLLTWIVTPSWGMRAAVLVVSIFALPLAAALSSS